jgi:hypothetical protein
MIVKRASVRPPSVATFRPAAARSHRPVVLLLQLLFLALLVAGCGDGAHQLVGPADPEPAVSADSDRPDASGLAAPGFSSQQTDVTSVSASATHVAAQNGTWHDPATWDGPVPSPLDHGVVALIPSGITVDVLPGEVVEGQGGALHVAGRLHVFGEVALDATQTEGAEVEIGVGGVVWIVGGSFGVVGRGIRSSIVNGGLLHNFGGSLALRPWTTTTTTAQGRLLNDGELRVGVNAEIENFGELENIGSIHLQYNTSAATGLPIIGEIRNGGGGRLVNRESGEVTVDGALRNAPRLGEATSSTLENHGLIVIPPSSSTSRGLLSNGGEEAPVIRNYGTIESQGGTITNNAARGRFENADGGRLLQGSSFLNVRGVMHNGAGGTFEVTGVFRNDAIIETASQVVNDNRIVNEEGQIRLLCGGSVSGTGVIEGDAPIDWCDTEPPELNAPGDFSVEATGPDGAVVTYEVTVTDNLDPDPALSCAPASGSLFPLGTTEVACIATDYVGNGAGAAFFVTVEDTTPPELELPADIVQEAIGPDGAVVHYGVGVSDLVDPDPAWACVPASGSTFPLGVTEVGCEATDFSGNRAEDSFVVTVEDTTPPELTLLGEPEVEVVQNNPYEDAGALAWDIVDGDVTDLIVVTNPVDTAVPGTYVVRYDVSDTRGNAAEPLTRTVVVISLAQAAAELVEMVDALDEAGSIAPLPSIARSIERMLAEEDGGAEGGPSLLSLLDRFDRTVERHVASGRIRPEDAEALLARSIELRIGVGG